MYKESEYITRPERRAPDFLWDGPVGDWLAKFYQDWQETGREFVSLRARQELMAEKFFPKGVCIPRHVITAQKVQEVISLIEQVSAKPDRFLGLRTAYINPQIGRSPWFMRREDETNQQCEQRAINEFRKWMTEGPEKPEAIIVMENPYRLGAFNEKQNSFILRLCLIHGLSGSKCVVEGGPWTDQTRDLECGLVKLFRGEVFYQIYPRRINVGSGIQWEDRDSYLNNPEVLELMTKINDFFLSRINLKDFLARMEAIYWISGHDTIQFQGRKKSQSSDYFDFFLGYGLRGAEELSLGKGKIATHTRY